jgi:hypothetical protein
MSHNSLEYTFFGVLDNSCKLYVFLGTVLCSSEDRSSRFS